MQLTNKSKLLTTLRFYRIKRNSTVTSFNHNDEDTSSDTDDPVDKKKPTMTIKDYISSKTVLSKYVEFIPPELLKKKKIFDALYLVDPDVAQKIYESISPFLSKNTNKVIAECNPGLGFLAQFLLKSENAPIKLFEPNKLFRTHLKKLSVDYPGKFQLYSKNLFKLPSYDYIDKIENGNRVETLLQGTPKKAWNDDPSISIIGPVFNNGFFIHLISALPTQLSLVSYGRVEIFAIMKPSHFWALSVEKDLYKFKYTYAVILFNLYFDYEVLCKVPRESFLPWQRENKKQRKTMLGDIDKDMLYLVRVVTKKDLPLPIEQMVPFNFFVRRFYNKNARVIPTFEFCVPDSGAHVILPRLQHDNYYENINIFTQFKELTPEQILEVFREMYYHPNYQGSPFLGMIESDIDGSENLQEGPAAVPDPAFMDEMEDLNIKIQIRHQTCPENNNSKKYL